MPAGTYCTIFFVAPGMYFSGVNAKHLSSNVANLAAARNCTKDDTSKSAANIFTVRRSNFEVVATDMSDK